MTQKCSVCSKACSTSCSCKKVFYCSSDCQKADRQQHKANCPKVEERQISVAKGRGLVTTREIRAGQTVLEESPMMLIKKCSGMDKEIIEEHKKLSREQKNKYGRLSFTERPGLKKPVNIWLSNAISTQVCQEDENIEGVYYQVALINHACSANSVINFTAERKIKIVAVETIPKGQEVLLNYLPPSNGSGEPLRRFKRRQTLESNFHFSCDCKLCHLTGQQLAQNENFKTRLTNRVKEMDQYRQDAKNSLVCQLEITHIISKLGFEMIRDYYRSVQKCYMLAKILTLEGVGLTSNHQPAVYRKVAEEEAAKLGESFVRLYNDWDKKYDQLIRQKTRSLVKIRRQLIFIG